MLEGRFLLVHLSPPLPDGSWDKAIVMASVRPQAQAAAKGFWQLGQPVTAWKVLQVRGLVANECCAARDMCVDGTPSIKPVSFLSNHACICELNAQCRGAHDHIDAHRLAPCELFGRLCVQVLEKNLGSTSVQIQRNRARTSGFDPRCALGMLQFTPLGKHAKVHDCCENCFWYPATRTCVGPIAS